MKVILLGTGPAVPIPRAGHRDPACLDARKGGKSRRTRSAALISSDDACVLLDAGPDIAVQLDRETAGRIDAVFLTHGHADACAGLRLLDRWLHVTCPEARIPVFTDPRTADRLKKRFPGLRHLAIETVRQSARISIGSIAIRPFAVPHSLTPGFPTRGYLFSQGGKKRLAYASDVSRLPPSAMRLLRGTPTLILDGAMYLGTRMAAHLSVDQAVRSASRLRTDRLVLTQIGHSYPPHAVAERAIRAHIRRLGYAFPKRSSVGFDGMRLVA